MSKAQDLSHAIQYGRRLRRGELLVTPDGDVFSYDVCIFRCGTRKLHIKKYSQTTTRHQNLVHTALKLAGIKFEETEEDLGRRGCK